MSECTNGELRDLLPELVHGRLDERTRAEVEAHVAGCAECSEELALLRALAPALAATPAVDTARIAAAVHARTSGAATRAPARARAAGSWRVAIAAATLLAMSALGYVVGTRRASAPEHVAAVPAPAPTTIDSPSHSTPTLPAQQPSPRQQVAVAPPHTSAAPRAPMALASTGMGENVSDLSDDELRALTASLDTLSAVPNADPSPGIDPLGASLDDHSAGGR